MPVSVSVIMPAYNEASNLADLVPRTLDVISTLGAEFELIVVDDGSNDDTPTVMAGLSDLAGVQSLRLRRNSGKSAALSAGIRHAHGDVIVLMDADGQDEPKEIPSLLDALAGGLDLVTGRRVQRNDRFVKRSASKVYNAVTASITGVSGHDFNSGLKAMQRELATSLELYGELHRYIPVLAEWSGFQVGEIDVVHHARLHGQTKFGRARFWRGFLDLMTVKFLTTWTARPFHLFGGIGVMLGVLGSALLAWMAVLRVTGHAVGNRPALLAGVLLVVVAVQMISLGLMAELIVHLRRNANLDDATIEES
jgi:glycosyltransferase involved in cell wall biosynthesis